MNYKIISIQMLALLLSACVSNEKRSSGDDSTGIQLGFTDTVKGFFGGLKKPMRSCRMGESLSGFNNTKKKDKSICTEEEMEVVRAYFGTFEGHFSGDSSGSIKIIISDGGFISGHGVAGGEQFKLVGGSSFVSNPLENYLQVHVGAQGRVFNFKGKMKEDGLLNTTWGSSKQGGSSTFGSLSLRKTAPYEKRQNAEKPGKPNAKGKETIKANSPSISDNTKLFDAAKDGDMSIIRKLIHAGYDLNAVDDNGATAFCIALQSGRKQAAQELMVFGSDKNHKDNNGRTPLHYAAMYDAEIIAASLIRMGADVSVKYKTGKTARDWALEKNNNGVIKMMDAFSK